MVNPCRKEDTNLLKEKQEHHLNLKSVGVGAAKLLLLQNKPLYIAGFHTLSMKQSCFMLKPVPKVYLFI